MKSSFQLLATLLFVSLLTACGTTSGLKSADAAKDGKPAKAVSLAGYDNIIVMNFKDNATSAPRKGGEEFAKRVASEIAATKAFSSVTREKRPGVKAIVVNGDVTRYQEGNAALRLMIGFGAGSSYFDSTVNFTDNQSGKKLADLSVDKNSWVGGGLMAATQDVTSHMNSAAQAIAAELKKAKEAK